VLLPPVRRRARYDLPLGVAFLAGAVSGALVLLPLVLILQGLVWPIPRAGRLALWVVASVAITVVNLVAGDCPLPQRRRQIPSEVIAAQSPGGAWRFGAALGTGLVTYLPSCAPHLLVVSLSLALTSVASSAAALAGFGVGRSIGVLARTGARDRDRFEHAFQRGVTGLARWGACPAVVVLNALWFVGV
jgi:hypothetical protein